jgi:hypothetical protein
MTQPSNAAAGRSRNLILLDALKKKAAPVRRGHPTGQSMATQHPERQTKILSGKDLTLSNPDPTTL